MADNKVSINISATDQASGALSAIQRKFTELNGQVENSTRKFTEMSRTLQSVIGAVSIGGMTLMTKSIIDAGLQVERLNKLFTAAAGSANLGAREFAYVKDTANRLGLDLLTTADSYGKFMAAIKGTSLEGEAGRKVFTSVSAATTALGLTTEKTQSIFIALQQMMSKGKVSAEELTSQLGESLTGAQRMAAQAMGMTTAELMKQMQAGNIMADELLPKLAIELDKTYGKAASEGASSAAAEINRMNTAMFEAKGAAGAALIPVFTDIVRAITPALSLLQEFIGGIQILAVKTAALPDKITAVRDRGLFMPSTGNQAKYEARVAEITANEDAAIADIMKKYTATGADYNAAEKLAQGSNGRSAPAGGKGSGKAAKADSFSTDAPGYMNWRAEQQLLEEESKWLQNFVKEQEALLGSYSVSDGPGFMNWRAEQQGLAEEAKYLADAAVKESERISAAYQEIVMQQEAVFDASPWAGLEKGFKDYADSIQSLGKSYETFAINTMNHIEDAAVDAAFSGTQAFEDMAKAILKDLLRIQAQMLLMKPLSNYLSSGVSALGSYFGGGSLDGAAAGNSYGVMASDAGYSGWTGPTFALGTNYVPQTGLALIHQGEAIIPASENRGGSGNTSISVPVTVQNGNAKMASELRSEIETVVEKVIRRHS